MSSSKQKTKTEEKTQVRPTVPGWVQGGVSTQQDRINELGGRPASDFVTGASPLQTIAIDAASGLSGLLQPRPGVSGGLPGMSKASLPVSEGGPQGPTASPVSEPQSVLEAITQQAQASQPNMMNLVGSASDIAMNAAAAPPPSYDATGPAMVRGYQPSTQSRAESAPVVNTADLIDSFMNPYTQSVIDPTMQSYDRELGKSRAAMQRDAAGANAFGGSGYGLALGEFDAVGGMNRSLIENQMRADAFNTAAGFAQNEAGRHDQVETFNAGQQNSMDALNLAARNDASRFGAGAANTSLMDYVNRADTAGAYNASQDAASLDRQLGLAGLLGNLGFGVEDRDLSRLTADRQYGLADRASDRSDIGLVANLGEVQRGIEQDYNNADWTQLFNIAALQGQQPYGMFVGQNVNSQGSSTTKSSPSALDTLGQVIQVGGQMEKF